MSMYDVFLSEDEDRDQLVSGLTLAVITNTQDPENLGRVKLKYLLRDEAENESNWARVMVPFAGSSMGVYWIPSVDDEVVVAFLGGRFDKPIVMGSVWSKTKKPPVQNEEGKNYTKMIKTKAGHQISFVDESDKETLTIESAKGQKIFIDDSSKVIEVKGKDGKNKVKIDSEGGNVEIEAGTKISIKVGQSSIEITADKIAVKATNIELKSTAGLKAEAGTTLDMKGSAAATLEGGASLTLKGAMTKIN